MNCGTQTPLNETTVASFVSYGGLFDYLLFTLSLCSVASLVGNILVITVIKRNKRLHNTHNYFVLNMAVSDVFMPTLQLLRVTLFDRKEAGHLSSSVGIGLCKFVGFFSYVSAGVSVFSFVVITVHRFYAVIYPTKKTMNKKRTCLVLLVCSWLAPAIVFCPRLHFITFNAASNKCPNTMRRKDRTLYNIFISVLITALPMLVMSILYSKIIRRLALNQNKFPRSRNNEPSAQATGQRRKNIRLTKMFATLISIYFLTWCTYKMLGFVAVYSRNTDKITMRKLRYIVSPLPSIFHAINPLIYFLFCPCFRKELRKMFPCIAR